MRWGSVVRPSQMCLIAILHPSSLALGPPSTTRCEPDTPSGERFCGRCSRSSAAKAPHDTALKLASMWPSCVNFAQVISSCCCSRIHANPCFHHIV
ncbi:hypothetical protein DE146DRAFT_698987 [Phaeosphaeria sp. MPI-PUGE-AT-0046c]|nr:hypothetical protein DE146DRAFT_698987 [Phaeosphaeria sp. MPI-PUGE-AT-0046c]